MPEIQFVNMPNDGGNFFIESSEKSDYIVKEPKSKKYIKKFLGAQEFLNGKTKYCLWFNDDFNPNDLDEMPNSRIRIKNVEKLRNNSSREATKKLAQFPMLFAEIRQPKSDFILIPRVSSENRKIIPMSVFSKDFIVGDTCLSIPKGDYFQLGILQSSMHMIWVNSVCGRLESRYRYSNEIVYNNFPWPENPTEKQIITIKEKVQKVLEARNQIKNCPLGKMYDIGKMHPVLVKAHNELDKAVDVAYSKQAFTSDAKRMEFLFDLYEKYTADLFTNEKTKRQKK